MEDLKVCLSVIRKFWKSNPYHVLVMSNGLADGHVVPPECSALADETIEVPTNPGHLKGNAELLKEGIARVASDCDHVILLEADTWIFTDRIINKYLKRLREEKAVWASAEWIEKYNSLGLDFVIADQHFLRANPKIFDFTEHAECYVCNYLRTHSAKYLFVKECMPTHLPKVVRRFYNPFGGRNRSFSRALMVTHHIEDLSGGLAEKKALANIVLGRMEFETPLHINIKKDKLKLRLAETIAKLAPRSKWIKPKKARKT